MLTRFIVLSMLIINTSCAPATQNTWQDTTGQGSEAAAKALEICRDFASRQYQPGVPAGEEYLKNQTDEAVFYERTTGGWRPDRSPHKTVNINAMPLHDVHVDYTGYPGELDYYPNYLDDILEKCMRDRGWEYSEVSSNH